MLHMIIIHELTLIKNYNLIIEDDFHGQLSILTVGVIFGLFKTLRVALYYTINFTI